MKAGLRRVGSAADGGRGLLDQVRYDLRLRDIDGVAGGDLADRGAGPVGHGPLGGRRDHPVFGGHEVPAGLGPPGRLADLAAQGIDAPRDLRVGQELGAGRREVAGDGAVDYRVGCPADSVTGGRLMSRSPHRLTVRHGALQLLQPPD